ncbi:OLC1v1029594C1 [Oldenlandia corymbosa var. corymbosa]|uniref:rRNA biogenesis protein RRP36 n=1 Tax=Oldenlandia corymbosa var. corymbosa TaxID=529605 RepID=A0AAV1CEZ1_OLDCO|nr:OLC1v1029594C1 [Oldenlandia corymbosa var. corymbosa]
MMNIDTVGTSNKIKFDESDDDEEEIEKELAEVTFEDLLRAKSDGSEIVYRKPKAEKKSGGRENKNRPMEMSSKKPVSRFREVIQVPKKVGRDPRFESLCGNLDVDGFKKRYDFLYKNELPAEKEELKKQLKKTNDPEVMDELRSRIAWIDKQLKSAAPKLTEKEILAEHKKKEKEAVKQGKRPYFLKKSEIRKQQLIEKYKGLKETSDTHALGPQFALSSACSSNVPSDFTDISDNSESQSKSVGSGVVNNPDEDSKVAAVVQGFNRRAAPPPPGYVCHRCNIPGHLIQHCSTNGDPNFDMKRLKRPIGIPISMLVPSLDGSYSLPTGVTADMKPNEAVFEKEIEGVPVRNSVVDLPPELHCPLNSSGRSSSSSNKSGVENNTSQIQPSRSSGGGSSSSSRKEETCRVPETVQKKLGPTTEKVANVSDTINVTVSVNDSLTNEKEIEHNVPVSSELLECKKSKKNNDVKKQRRSAENVSACNSNENSSNGYGPGPYAYNQFWNPYMSPYVNNHYHPYMGYGVAPMNTLFDTQNYMMPPSRPQSHRGAVNMKRKREDERCRGY